MDRAAVVRVSGEEGYSLVEILITIVILAAAFIATMGGLATVIIATDFHRQQSESEGVLNSAIEKIKPQSSIAYANCAAPSAYQSTGQSAATDVGWPPGQVAVTSILFWNGTSYDSDQVAGHYLNGTYTAAANCNNPLLRRQLITVQVTNPDGRAVRTASFVKAP